MKAALITGLKRPYPIVHVRSSSPYMLAMSFLRMQEHYESPNPRFRSGVFSLEQFMDWYVKHQPARTTKNRDLKGHFTYPMDWTGFNVPDHVVRFFADFFPAKSQKEQRLLELIWAQVDAFAHTNLSDWRATGAFYVIGTCSKDPDEAETVEHEIRHGVFHTNARYRSAVIRTINRHPAAFKRMAKHLREAGYGDPVLYDEVNAYATTGWRIEWKPTPSMEKLARDLKRIEKEFIR